MTTVTQMKCACDDCLCIVDISSALQQEGQYYCSETCANGHSAGGSGCGHTGCNCHS
ncbi:MAG: metallothionein [Cyanobacteria bacterium]|nr:metallothionein [Cyanobacteriota bacterium]MDA0865966.1 metallothionein [Cyanobacteriota bacterium]